MKIESVLISVIDCSGRLREADPEKISGLAQSIKSIGLLNPIHLHTPDDGQTVRLVAGLHRLEAVKSLGWDSIDAILFEGDSIDCRLAEIAENLHRAELTAAERADQVAEWIRLTEEKQAQQRAKAEAENKAPDFSANLDEKSMGRPEGGVAAASRELDIPETTAKRAVKIASMTPAAKKAAKAAGLDNNQSALERIARKPESDQVAEVAKIKAEHEERERQKKAEREKDEEQRRLDATEKEFQALVKAWAKARPSVRERFRSHIG